MTTATSEPTIASALDAFLAEQKARLSPTTFARYADVVHLLRSCLNSYGHQSLDAEQKRRFEAAYDAGDEEAFCSLFGPQKIIENYGEFLEYFMVRKVMANADLLRASGTVTGKLATWLHDQGYIGSEETADAIQRATAARRDLPRALELGDLLHDVAESTPRIALDDVNEADLVEDSLEITRIEPGQLWFGGHGPIDVPGRASELAKLGWSAWVVLMPQAGRWRLVEIGFVYP